MTITNSKKAKASSSSSTRTISNKHGKRNLFSSGERELRERKSKVHMSREDIYTPET